MRPMPFPPRGGRVDGLRPERTLLRTVRATVAVAGRGTILNQRMGVNS